MGGRGLETCSKIILEVNENLPRMQGGLDHHIKDVTAFHEATYPLPVCQEEPPTAVEAAISDYIADLVSDGDCLELGTGTLSNAIAERLMDHRELGLHTEWFNTGVGDLIKNGIITGEHKNIDTGLAVASAAWGEERLYEILRDNPRTAIRPASYVCAPSVISQMNNMIAINTLVEMDLTGQVCSESIGPRQISGSSGNLCFSLGAILQGRQEHPLFSVHDQKGNFQDSTATFSRSQRNDSPELCGLYCHRVRSGPDERQKRQGAAQSSSLPLRIRMCGRSCGTMPENSSTFDGRDMP